MSIRRSVRATIHLPKNSSARVRVRSCSIHLGERRRVRRATRHRMCVHVRTLGRVNGEMSVRVCVPRTHTHTHAYIAHPSQPDTHERWQQINYTHLCVFIICTRQRCRYLCVMCVLCVCVCVVCVRLVAHPQHARVRQLASGGVVRCR